MRGTPVSFRIAIARKSPAALPQRGLSFYPNCAGYGSLRGVVTSVGGVGVHSRGSDAVADGNWLTHDDRRRRRLPLRAAGPAEERGAAGRSKSNERGSGARGLARRRRRSRGFARCSAGCREFTGGPARTNSRGASNDCGAGASSVVAATRVVTTVNARAFVEAAFASRTCRSGAGTVAFATAVTTTTTTTATATRPASGTLAAIALGTLLLPVAHRRCGGCGVDHVHVAGNRCDDRGNGGGLLTRFLRLAILTRRPRFTRLARFARLARRTRLLRLALALLAAVTARLALARAAFACRPGLGHRRDVRHADLRHDAAAAGATDPARRGGVRCCGPAGLDPPSARLSRRASSREPSHGPRCDRDRHGRRDDHHGHGRGRASRSRRGRSRSASLRPAPRRRLGLQLRRTLVACKPAPGAHQHVVARPVHRRRDAPVPLRR